MLRTYTSFIRLPRRGPSELSAIFLPLLIRFDPSEFIMRLPFFAALIATASTATPTCARRGQIDLSSPSAALALIEPPVQMDLMRCLAICRLYPGCGGFASTGKKLPTDWCFIFKAGVYGDYTNFVENILADSSYT